MKTIMQNMTMRLATMLLFAAATLMPQVANAVGTQPSGDGTISSPYQISNAGELYWFAEQVNNGNTDIDAVLTADIVVNENVLDADGELNGDGSGFKVWTPIGLDEDGKKYEGTFDGQGHTISGLYINDEEKSVVGLFCALGSTGIVKNVGVIDSYFYANSYSAGICGSNAGTVENCFNAATCKAFRLVAGGIAGWHSGTIKNCYNIGFISGPQSIGSVCGSNYGDIINSYYLIGSCDSGEGTDPQKSIKKNLAQFASGEVTWLLNGCTYEGDLAWYQNLSENADAYPVPNSSHGIVYQGYDICYLTYSNSPISTTPGAHPGSYDENGFCTKCGHAYLPATLISEGNYEIENAGQLYWFAEQVNNGNTTINAKLTADIVVNENVLNADGELNGDGSGFKVWTPIGLDEDGKKYIGTFDGQGHTISGLYINDEEKSVVGLFCATSTNSVIKNVGIVDSYFCAYQHAAGICGSNGGVIDNCYSGATCIVSKKGAGGIVSWNGGTIVNCYNKGLIAGTESAAVCCNNQLGTIANCYFLRGTASVGIVLGSGKATVMAADQFASGEVTWLLNGSTAEGEVAWHQNLGENSDTYPVLDRNHGIVHMVYDECLPVYSNSNLPITPPEHLAFENGFCKKCGSYQEAKNISEGSYEIENAGQLYWFAEQVNSGNSGINAKLTADIVVNENVLDADGELNGDGSGFKVWTPIGLDEYGKKYEGTFDGQGHTISGLYFNDDSQNRAGLFGETYNNSKIQNVGIIDSYFYAGWNAGGLSAYNSGTITNCYNTSTIAAMSDNASSVTRTAGGICGFNMGAITNCYSTGFVKLSVYKGDICGSRSRGTIANCYHLEGSGLQGIGYGSGITIAKTAEQFASGEVAWLLNGSTAEGEVAWHQNLGENSDAYPVLDKNHGTVLRSCAQTYTNYLDGHVGYGDNNGFCTNCGTVQEAVLDGDTYAITNAGQLYWFAEQVNGGNATIKGKLTADITMSGYTDDYVIGTSDHPFKGEFDGGNHTISGVNVTTAKTGVNNNQYVAGLFGCINASDGTMPAVVKDLTVEGSVNITGLTTKYYAGGVIGIAYGNVNVSNVISRVDVTTGSNGQKGHCGGVVASGEWFGSTNGYLNVSNCANYGTLNVACADVCGGVIGYIRQGSIINCLNVGDITNSEDGHTSGVLGYVREDGASISRCLNVGHVTNTKNSEKVNPVCHINGTVSTSVLFYKIGVCGTATNATAVSGEELASGEVAWLLNGSKAGENPAWRQTIGEDEYPVLDTTKGIVVYSTWTSLNSIIRPTAGTLVGALDVYNFAGIDGKKVYGIEHTGTLAANHPYIFTTGVDYVSFVPSDEEVTDDMETYGLTGVLETDGLMVYGMGNTAGEEVSIVFTASAMKYANANGNLVKYGKCYIHAEECFITYEPVPAMAKSIANFGEGGITSIDEMDASAGDGEGKAYNLMGIEVGDDYKGIVIVNGKKMLRK